MKIWVDCTAAAHPLVLRPIVERLQAQGHEVFITAREYGQTLGILDRLGMPYTAVGEHGGASRAGQGAGAGRALGAAGPGGLGAAAAAGDRPRLGRPRPRLRLLPGPLGADAGLRVRAAAAPDRLPPGTRVLAPSRSRSSACADRRQGRKLVRYPGLKEEYYLADFEPDPAVLGELGLDREKVLVVVRPPPETSEYHAPNDLYAATVRRLAAARRGAGGDRPPHRGAGGGGAGARRGNLIVPERAIDAQSLIAHADLVVSAGGTMNREAVALGTPVFTTFTGRMGGVDEALIAAGRLRVLEDPEALPLRKRETPVGVLHRRDPQLLVDAALAAVAAVK